MSPNFGKYLVVIGLVIVLVGIIFYFFHDKLQWFGRLPGDIRVEREGFRFYFPVVTMLLLSLLLNLIIVLIRKFFG